jgi:hypothetical protein
LSSSASGGPFASHSTFVSGSDGRTASKSAGTLKTVVVTALIRKNPSAPAVRSAGFIVAAPRTIASATSGNSGRKYRML